MEDVSTGVNEIKYSLDSLIGKIDDMETSQAEKLLSELDEVLRNLPINLAAEWKIINEKSADYRDVKAKLKIAIPIIPTILSYDTEISIDLRATIKKIYSDFKNGKYFLQK